jgi:hypothetical protein
VKVGWRRGGGRGSGHLRQNFQNIIHFIINILSHEIALRFAEISFSFSLRSCYT